MTDAIISGLILGLASVFSVGPVVFTIIKLRINYGIKSAFYFIAGVWLSDLIMVFLANFFGHSFKIFGFLIKNNRVFRNNLKKLLKIIIKYLIKKYLLLY